MQKLRHVTSTSFINSLFFLIQFLGFSAFQQVNQGHTKVKTKIFPQEILPDLLKAEVIAIQDGDTIELKFIFSGKKAGHRKGQTLRIRLLHVNCPERGQPFYKVAKQFTSEKSFRKVVQIRHTGNFDRYGRLLGEVVLPDGKVLNKELVKSGLAVHFKKYSASEEYADLEAHAKKKKLGMWAPGQVNFGIL